MSDDTPSRKDLRVLSPEQRELLRARLRRKMDRDPLTMRSMIPRVSTTRPATEPVPATPLQERLLFGYLYDPGAPARAQFQALRICGDLRIPVLAAALRELVRRHEALRTVLVNAEDRVLQKVLPNVSFALPLLDLRSVAADLRGEMGRILAEEPRRPFALSSAPPIRAKLLQLAGDEHVLLLTVHAAAADPWSLGVFIRELWIIYEAFAFGLPSPLPAEPWQLRDFAAWQRQWLQGEEAARELALGRERLRPVAESRAQRAEGFPAPGSRRRRAVSKLEPALAGALAELAQTRGVTRFMVLASALQAVLARRSGKTLVPVGVPVVNRWAVELEAVVGPLSQVLLLAGHVQEGDDFSRLLERTRGELLGANATHPIPFETLAAELGLGFDFEALLVYEPWPRPLPETRALSVEIVTDGFWYGDADLVLTCQEHGGEVVLAADARADLYDALAVVRLLEQLESFLRRATREPTAPVAEIPLWTEAERHALLREWSGAGALTLGAEECLHERFARVAAATPDAVAVAYGDQRLSYGALETGSNRLAWRLRRLGVGPGDRVGLCLERSAEMVVAILATLKAGAAYVPLDPAFPAERLAYMMEDSGAAVLLTTAALASERYAGARQTLVLDEEWADLAQETATAAPAGLREPRLPAYIIYTSGSTGRPKGVIVGHASVIALFAATENAFGFGPRDVWTLFHSYAFDFSVWEIWGALLHGGRLVVVPYEVAWTPGELRELLGREDVSILSLTPLVFHLLVEAEQAAGGTSSMDGLRLLAFGGEALAPTTVLPWMEAHGDERPMLVNLYGPTEVTVHATAHRVRIAEARSMASIAIGRPIPGDRTYLLDNGQRTVPAGSLGELYIGGSGLAQGYQGRPELTAERFIPDPFSDTPGDRLYRTGDLARHRPDGSLEYLGRIDHQVKVRGFRIELGEIEAALLGLPEVREAAVAVRQDRPGDRQLVAYVVPRDFTSLRTEELRTHLRERLPDYMVPAVFVALAELPLTPNGKVDRRALPAPEEVSSEATADYLSPRTPTEEIVATIWADVLRIDRVGVRDDFFALGGHSLLATQVVSRLRRAFPIEPRLSDLFEHPTVESLSRVLDTALRRSEPPPEPEVLSRTVETRASFAQERLWFVDQMSGDDVSYNIPMALRLAGDVCVPALAAALGEVVRRHHVLRATFAMTANQVLQQVAPWRPMPLPLVDLGGLSPAGPEARRLEAREAARRFDLGRGPLVHAVLVRLDATEHLLLVNFHHIVCDGWSISIFTRELGILYEAFAARKPSPLPELPLQYADFADWQRQWLDGPVLERQLDYWRGRLAGAPEVVTLPPDRPRPAVLGSRGGRLTRAVDPRVLAGLRSLARREDATLFMVALAAFASLLRRYTGQDDLVLGTPIAHHRWGKTENLIGLFVNTVVLRLDVPGDLELTSLLARARLAMLEAFDHQDLPFERLVEELRPGRSLSRTPLFQILFVFHPLGVLPAQGGGLVQETRLGAVGAKFDLTCTLTEGDGDLAGEAEYNHDLFDAPTLHRFMDHFWALLAGIVEDPARPILSYNLLRDAERHVLSVEWNDTAAAVRPLTVPERFVEQARLAPDAVAVVSGAEHLTYATLEARSGRLARRLASRGVGPEVPVALLLARTPSLPVALLGVLRAGGAYVPLDPEGPAERLAEILADLDGGPGGPLLLADEPLLARVPAPPRQVPGRRIGFGGESAALARGPAGFAGAAAPEHLAYVLYTSGTTGEPKGVAVEHRSVAALLDWALGFFQPGERSAVLASTPLTFDLSVFELLLPLTTGGRTVLVPDPLALLEPDSLPEVTLINTVPSLLAGALKGRKPLPAATVSLAGEALHRPLVTDLYQSGSAGRVVNLYGPTESTVYATAAAVPEEETREPALGRPVGNTRAFVVDERFGLQPTGAPGELVLAGAGLARGYWGQPDRTAARFVPDPFGGPGERLYRTGDLARVLPDGQLEFLGRIDRQVKVRGVRLEPGAIEAALRRQPRVEEAVVVLREDPRGDRRLVAYVQPRPDAGEPLATDLSAGLQQLLPRAAVPSAFVVLERLPRTVRGKLDLRALPMPDWAGGAAPARFVAPRGEVEELLAAIWSEILGVRRVSSADDFFDLGGHSLLAAQVRARVEEAFGVDLPLRSVFEKPRLEALAREIEQIRAAAGETERSARAALPLRADVLRQRRKPHVPSPSAAEDEETADLLGALLREKARALPRRTEIRFPAKCPLQVPATLHFQLVVTGPVDPLLQRLARLSTLRQEAAETLLLKVTAPGFRVTPRLARARVPVDGDSEAVAFTLIPLEPGDQLIELEVFAEADRVGYFTLESEAVEHVH